MRQIYDFGSFFVFEDKLSSVAKDAGNNHALTVYFDGASDGVKIIFPSEDDRDSFFNEIKKEYDSINTTKYESNIRH